MSQKLISPKSLGKSPGYSHGVLTEPGGRTLFISGQIGRNQEQSGISRDFVAQFDQALANVIAVVTTAGGTPNQIVRLVIYVVDKQEYRRQTKEIGKCYRARMGKHFPAMVLVEVKGLLDDEARVEIEGTAVISESRRGM
jgi:enamine deaminase RidA (YjgF/YER057c/UK114 family)